MSTAQKLNQGRVEPLFERKLAPVNAGAPRWEQLPGTVRGRETDPVDGERWLVDTDRGLWRLRRAAGCLLEPAEGDVVLCAGADADEGWVLSVLERAAPGATVISSDGDLELRSHSGQCAIRSNGGIEMTTADEVKVTSRAVSLNAIDASVVLQRMTYLGRFVQAEVEKIRTIASTFDTIADRISQKAKRSYRKVEEYDCLKAGQIDYVADSTFSVRGETAMVTASGLVKFDGPQIHIG